MKETYYYQVSPDGFSISIVSKSFWDANKCLNDRGIPDGVMPAGFYELCESTYEFDGSTQDGINVLNAAGFVEKTLFE